MSQRRSGETDTVAALVARVRKGSGCIEPRATDDQSLARGCMEEPLPPPGPLEPPQASYSQEFTWAQDLVTRVGGIAFP